MQKPLTLPVALLFSLLCVNSASAVDLQITSEPNTESMTVHYSQPGKSDSARYGYIFELIHQILEVTRTEFGSYTIDPYRGTELSTQRYAMLLSKGSTLNLGWGPPGSTIANSDSTAINVDIFHNLLGYRICLINNIVSLDLANIKSVASLRPLKIGQGINWADNPIYLHNNITIVEAPLFESLFKMLALNRFDCLALGANEVQDIYHEKKDAYPFLQIDSHLLIYYSFPIYFYVSNKTPKLAERIDLGLKKLQKNGELNRLFIQYHAKELKSLNLKNRNVICLESPYLVTADQCRKPIILPDL